MGSNPVGPVGPHECDEDPESPATERGAGARPKKKESSIGPTGPRTQDIGPTGPSLKGDRTTGNY